MVSLLALLLICLAPGSAAAWGTFLAPPGSSAYVEGQRVVLVDEGDGHVTAIVQTSFQGVSTELIVLLAVPSEPTVALGSTQAIDMLDDATRPDFRIDGGYDWGCQSWLPGDLWPSAGNVWAGQSPPTRRPDDVVQEVLDLVTFEPSSGAALLAWLNDRNVIVVDDVAAEVSAMSDAGSYVVGVRIAGADPYASHPPVSIRYEGEQLDVPHGVRGNVQDTYALRTVWALGVTAQVPVREFEVELNLTRLNWFYPEGPSYGSLLHGVASEIAEPAWVVEARAETSLLTPPPDDMDGGEFERWRAAAANATTDDERRAVAADLLVEYADWDGMADVVADVVLTEGGRGAAAELLVCVEEAVWGGRDVARDCMGGVPSMSASRLDDLVDAWHTRVYVPWLEFWHQIDQPFLTRLATASAVADGMLMAYAAAPWVDAQHMARFTPRCSSGRGLAWIARMPAGDELWGSTVRWPDLTGQPAVRQGWRISSAGERELIVDNTTQIRATLPGPPLPRPVDDGRADAGGADTADVAGGHEPHDGGNGGCSAVSGSPPIWLAALPLLAVLRRRATRSPAR